MSKACCALQVEVGRHDGVAEFLYRYDGHGAPSGVAPRSRADAGTAESASIETCPETGRAAQTHFRFHRHRRHDANSDRASDATSDATSRHIPEGASVPVKGIMKVKCING